MWCSSLEGISRTAAQAFSWIDFDNIVIFQRHIFIVGLLEPQRVLNLREIDRKFMGMVRAIFSVGIL
jgi:hypothetical protein